MAINRRTQYRRGDIRLFFGEESDIPRGWEIVEECKDRALVGAGNNYSNGQFFGNNSVTPSASIANHTLSTARIPSHSHKGALSDDGVGGSTDYGRNISGAWYADVGRKDYFNTQGIGSSGAHNHGATISAVDTRQASVAIFVIRRL